MEMTKWRLGFYSFCLVALALASNAVNTLPQDKTRKIASRSIASGPETVLAAAEATDTKIAIDRAVEEEILIVTPEATIYKRTRYVEKVRAHIQTQKALLVKINDKSAEIERKNKEIESLKAQRNVAAGIIALAIQDVQKLEAEKSGLQTDLAIAKRHHAQEKERLEADITRLEASLSTEEKARLAEVKLKEEALESLRNEKGAKESEIRLKEEALSKLAEETGLKEQALLELEESRTEFTKLQEEMLIVETDLDEAEVEIERLEGVVADLEKSVSDKDQTISEQETKITEQETQITEQGAQLADLRIAECEQRKQLKELKEQVETFTSEKEEMDKVVAALKEEKKKMAKEREEERLQMEALMQQFTMYAMLMSQQPQPQMPMINTNPLTDSSMTDWNQYMALAMMNNFMGQPGNSPFDFNGGNSQVNSYYYMPKQATDAYLYHSSFNPTGTYWGDMGPNSYFGRMGQGFDFRQGPMAYGQRNPAAAPSFYGF